MEPQKKRSHMRDRERVNGYVIDYQPKFKRYLVQRFEPFYEVVAAFERRAQAYQFTLTHISVEMIERLLRKRIKKQLENLKVNINWLAEEILKEELLIAYKSKRKRKSKREIIKSIKNQTKTASDV